MCEGGTSEQWEVHQRWIRRISCMTSREKNKRLSDWLTMLKVCSPPCAKGTDHETHTNTQILRHISETSDPTSMPNVIYNARNYIRIVHKKFENQPTRPSVLEVKLFKFPLLKKRIWEDFFLDSLDVKYSAATPLHWWVWVMWQASIRCTPQSTDWTSFLKICRFRNYWEEFISASKNGKKKHEVDRLIFKDHFSQIF